MKRSPVVIRLLLILIFSTPFTEISAGDSARIRVHFLYGSKPAKHFRKTEPRWFGGVHGGHVGIETGDDEILNFLKTGKLHLFSHGSNRHSRYVIHTVLDFYAILGGNSDSMKKAVITIPISLNQKKRLDSISSVYRQQTPYDYAFIGMRCAAATYEILGQLSVVPCYKKSRTISRIFYPKKLRKRLLRMAADHHWEVKKNQGSLARKWEKD